MKAHTLSSSHSLSSVRSLSREIRHRVSGVEYSVPETKVNQRMHVKTPLTFVPECTQEGE